jgi:periplasmic divalent cation tolerance protein
MFVLVYVTNPSKEEAKKIAKHLLEKRLIACANIYDNVSSLYRWEGKIADEKECVLIAKTTEDKFEAVKDEIEKIHPYKTPCIIKIPVSSNKKFSDWLKGEVAENL